MSIRPLLALVLAFCLTVVTACSGGADAVERSNITYDDIRNTGKANDCPVCLRVGPWLDQPHPRRLLRAQGHLHAPHPGVCQG